ncbi:hypothetical protein [Lederbergia lenta]|uniref:Uncharacterized protein n=1 Tax=Lederbergia lenta TaxID=1467 RepID=A0A2X4YHY3_LEDLE|nr:hypothetical protein [Lederbergia lenta]MEC2326379.1 hypothetical protein [Lederbergia lenta]SQI51375.1 Uncharacterised protein [Lederbergia lenta]
MKRFFISLFVFGLLTSPLFANAHVKWFTKVNPEKETLDTILSPLFIILTFLTAIFLALLTILIRKTEDSARIKLWEQKYSNFKHSQSLLRYGTALALIIQVTNGTLFAPEFHLQQSFSIILIWIAIICLLIPSHYATKASSLILLCLFIQYIIENGLFHMLDYSFYFALILFFLLIKTRWEKAGFPLLYIITGISLCWVAVEKWVYPNMTVNIIEAYNVPTFGFEPTIFIVMAAFIEFIIGYSWIAGILNRSLGIIFTIILILTTMLFGYAEFIGHFMIHVILITFILEGKPLYKTSLKRCQTVTEQCIFIFCNFLLVISTFVLVYYRFA